VILEEILDEVDDKRRDRPRQPLKRALFPDHPLGLDRRTRDTVAPLTEGICARSARAMARGTGALGRGSPCGTRVLELAEKHSEGCAPAKLRRTAERRPRGPQLIAVDHVESQMELQVSFRAAPESIRLPVLRVIKRILTTGSFRARSCSWSSARRWLTRSGRAWTGSATARCSRPAAPAPAEGDGRRLGVLRVLAELRGPTCLRTSSRAKKKSASG
jgi:hypothetical protein